jgi:hypothetical protein
MRPLAMVILAAAGLVVLSRLCSANEKVCSGDSDSCVSIPAADSAAAGAASSGVATNADEEQYAEPTILNFRALDSYYRVLTGDIGLTGVRFVRQTELIACRADLLFHGCGRPLMPQADVPSSCRTPFPT